jgi:tetratricopeptide (TPR) repeat protein
VDSLIAAQPDEPIWQYQLGRISSVSGKQLERGEAALNAYVKIPETRNRTLHAVARYRLGLIYEKQGRKDLAKDQLVAALSDQPRHGEAKKALGRVD